MPGHVLLLTGPPGAGKTTTARILAAGQARSVHLESDLFFHFVSGGYVEPWRPESHDQNVTVMRAVGAAAAGYSDGGYLTVVEGIISPAWFLEPLVQHLAGSGHAVSYAVLRPPLRTCLARISSRGNGQLSDPEVTTQLWQQFADLGPVERYVLETDEDDADSVAGAVAERLRRGSLAISSAVARQFRRRPR